ncbi:MAG: DNA/RNA non-specific endonuclease [Candidatus Solibacter usitatus]|nr:DNA/RNA non-specific endonuclease [Candidatus Solibacter usitatus]
MALATLFLAFLPVLSAQPDRFSTPACTGPGRELAARSTFLICYDSNLRVPVWTGYELTRERIHGSARRPHGFQHDYGLSGVSAYDSDYRNSGYSRGHMAPAADFAWSDEAIRATFLLSNAVPQVQAVNQGAWSTIERAVRRIAATADAVYVFTGVLFEDEKQQRIGARQVAVPSHTYKVVLAIKGDSKTMYAAIVPNADVRGEAMENFMASVEEVECRTGFDFFSALADGERSLLHSQRRMILRTRIP